ncbi:hypothetical protein [Streptomyces anandii]|uniref:hypothetical protein n=1 Tax=Streptomyces anandii TaxID=285454 RepID=UPI0037936974
MRRILTTTAAVLAALILAGCSSSSSETDQKYADAVAAADPDDFGGIDTGKLASTLGDEGPQLCDQMKSSYEDAVAYARTGFSDKASAALISAAVLVYCPDQRTKLPAG